MITSNILQEILKTTNALCCLCYNTVTEDEPMQINDEVNLTPEDDLGNTISMSAMIDFVLHQEDFVSTFICTNCVMSTIKTYKFIHMCKSASQRLTKVINSITNCLDQQDEKKKNKAHRIFIATDVNGSQSRLNYDNKRVLPHSKGFSEIQCILSRFQAVCFPETLPKYICDACGCVCTNRAHLVKHIKKNCTPNEEKRTCVMCGMSVSKRCIARHERCCGKRAVQHLGDTNHSTIHKPYLCSICGKSFMDLKKHLESHDPHNAFECKVCGKKYRSMKSWKKHVDNEMCTKQQKRDPSESKAHKCDVCNSQFCTLSGLKLHMRIHSDNKDDYYECRWCNKRFACQAQLTAHSVTHTKEKNWKCNICGGHFVTKASLTYHIRTHTGEKPFKCELCERSFLSASRRRDHMRSKHLPPLLECPYCKKRFKLHVELSKHRRRHLDPKSSLYIGKKHLDNTLKDSLCSKIPTSKTKKCDLRPVAGTNLF